MLRRACLITQPSFLHYMMAASYLQHRQKSVAYVAPVPEEDLKLALTSQAVFMLTQFCITKLCNRLIAML